MPRLKDILGLLPYSLHSNRGAVERNLRHYQNVKRAIFARICQQGVS